MHDSSNAQSLSSDQVWAIHEDLNGILWIGTPHGLNKFDRDKQLFTRFAHDPSNPHTLGHDFVMSIYEDRAHTLWIGTMGGGLNRFDRQAERFTRFLTDPKNPNSLSDNHIWALYADHTGRLWIGTNSGLNCFDPKTKTFRNYDRLDGLPGNEFMNSYAHKGIDGKIFFQSVNSVMSFHPDSIKDNSYMPPVVITAFKRYNTDDAKGIAIEEKGISAKNEISVSYKDNVLSFEFAALSYRNTFKNQYAYKLEGFNDNWIQLGTKREVTFTNLDHGEERRAKCVGRHGLRFPPRLSPLAPRPSRKAPLRKKRKLLRQN